MEGAAGWQLSNAQIFPMAAHKAALDIFEEAGMDALRKKSELLTSYAEYLIGEINKKLGEKHFQIITPMDPAQRGCQLSIIAAKNGKETYDRITAAGVVADWRSPSVIRIAPVPLYNTFEDVYKFAELLGT